MKISLKRLVLFTLCFQFACGGSSSSQLENELVQPPANTIALSFTDVAATRGLQFSSEFSANYNADPRHFAGGAASGDIDGDNDIDLFITRGDTQANLLLINNAGVFVENTPSVLALPNEGIANYKLSGPSFADIDGDNDLDIFVGGLDGDPSFVFRNDGDLVFTDVTLDSGIDLMNSTNTISAAFGDYDLDGDLDLVMAHWGTARDALNPGETETLWRNDTDASGVKFTPVSLQSGIANQLALDLPGMLGVNYDYTFAPNFADINDDGYPDLLNVSDFLGTKVFLNNTDGTFTDVTDVTQITDTNGMGAAVGDYDNDGDLDWFVSSINGNRLYNNSSGVFMNQSANSGIEFGGWGWGSCFADFDLDGYLDIYQTNGWINNAAASSNAPHTEDPSRLWMSDKQGGFVNLAAETRIEDKQQGRGVVCADFDNDRDVDVLLLLNQSSQAAMLWLNNANTLNNTNAISIVLQGPAPNTKGIGAKITLRVGSQTQMREVSIGSNFSSHNPSSLHFGLGENTLIDELVIHWPDGTVQTQVGVSVNQDLLIIHPNL